MSSESQSCYLCKDAGRISVAHRILPSGKGVCREHYEGFITVRGMPDPPPAAPSLGNCALQNHIAAKEATMPAKKAIDLEAFKRDYEAGMSAKDLTAKYEIAGNSASYWARKAGARIRRSGNQPHHGNNRPEKRQTGAAKRRGPRLATRNSRTSDGSVVTICVHQDFLDNIWAKLSLVEKAELLEGLGKAA